MIKKLVPEDFVRQHPERYWGGNSKPGPDEISAAIADQMRRDGCGEIASCSSDGWHVVCCELDWVEMIEAQFGSVARVFASAVTTPAPPAGGLRVEWLVGLLASVVQVWVNGRLVFAQGSSEFDMDETAVPRLAGRACIAYRLAAGHS